jgi:hypothetical protein
MNQITQTLKHASEQWRSRPADERFDSLASLRDHTVRSRAASTEVDADMSRVRVEARDGAVVVIGPNGGGAYPTHHAFGQLCSRAGAPAGYLRTLPAEIAASAVSHGLKAAAEDGREASLLLRRVEGGRELHAATSQRYARVWNAEIAQRLVDLQGEQPWWDFPTAFRHAGEAKKASDKVLPVAFASDSDMFVFLCDYEHGVEIRQADGTSHTLARGFTISNSEVGAGKLEAKFFLFDYVCSNVMIWGARVLREIDIVHTGRARDRFADGFGALRADLEMHAQSSDRADAEAVARAQRILVGDTKKDVLSSLYGTYGKRGLGRGVIEAAYTVVEETPRYGDPRSVWGLVNGLTEVSQREGHADGRRKLDEIAGDLMSRAF